MPYSNVPESKWPAMDRCVTRVMDEQGLPKERAIAICHKSIMGSKKAELPSQVTFNINLSDYWKEKMEENFEDLTEQIETEVSDEKKIKTEGGETMKKQNIAKEDVIVETPAEEAVVEEAPAAEAAEEKPAEGTESAPAEETATEEKEEIAEASPVSDLLKQVLGKVEEIQASLKKEDEPASAEGAASEEAAPEGGEVDSPVEETAPEGASPEGAEEVAKVSASLSKIADSIEKMTQKFDDLEKRVNSLEEQPAPSKVSSPKVVTKAESNDSESPNKERIDEINTELGKLEELKRVNLDGYQKEKAWEKAFKLIEERDILRAQAPQA